MPRTMCRTSASGCSRVGAPEALDSRRAQSVLDLVEVDLRFTLCGFAEGDDADFTCALRVDDGYWNTSEEPESNEPLLTVREPIVFKSEGKALEYTRGIDEVEPVNFQIRSAFSFRPSELHAELYIQIVMTSIRLPLRSNA